MIQSFELTPVSRKARVEIIPLIDVVFFLLATFVLFTLSLQKIMDLSASLPKSVKEISVDDVLYIQAVGPGLFSWHEGRYGAPEQIDLKNLGPRLNEFRHRTKSPRVAISGDNTVKLGETIRLLDEVRKAGMKEVSIETR